MMMTLLLAAAVDTVTLTTKSRDMQVGRDMMEMQVAGLKVSGKCETVKVLDGKLTHDGQSYVWTYTVACKTP